MKTFYTLFYTDEAVHLIKDVGMFPYYLSKMGYYEAHFVSHIDTSIPSPYYDCVQGLHLDYVEPKHMRWYRNHFFSYGSLYRYLWRHAREIDVLNLYHVRPSIIPTCIYRIRNRKGTIWLKGDLDLGHFPAFNTLKGKIVKEVLSFEIRHLCDVITLECQSVIDKMYEVLPLLRQKIRLLYDGVDDLWLAQRGLLPTNQPTNTLHYDTKENIIVTVARFGTSPKNTEMLLEVAAKIQWQKDWKIVAIGSIEPSFQPIIDAFFKEHPQMNERIEFIGVLSDRQKLFGWYRRSKIFCCTSHWESFGIAIMEAIVMGNYLVSTPIQALPDFIDDGRCGRCVGDAEQMASFLSQVISDESVLREAYPKIIEHSKRFYMSNLTKQLVSFLT